MISYKIQIVIDEDHEDNFDDIIKNIYDHIERIDGITEVHGDPESYFEYNEDINYEEEEDEMTDEEVVAVIKGTETAMFYDEEERYRVECADCDFVIKFRANSWERAKDKYNNYLKGI